MSVVNANGTDGANATVLGVSGGDAGSIVATAATATDATNDANANDNNGAGGITGGIGGSGDGSGNGGAGGAAEADATTTLVSSGAEFATAVANGGTGGGSSTGLGGAGGDATGAVSVSGGSSGTANIQTLGGSGGNTDGGAGGAAGVASGTTAYAEGTKSASATVAQTGGNGGADYGSGGVSAGADSSLTNAVSGQTSGGTLSLAQTAIGGQGGSSQIVGATGGSGYSSLTFDDLTMNPTSLSASITSTSAAYGGNGGAPVSYGDTSGRIVTTVGAAGNAVASNTTTGSGTVDAYSYAYGGDGGGDGTGGTGSSDIGGLEGDGLAGGAATASATATGANAVAQAEETAGTGGTAAGAGYQAGAGGAAGTGEADAIGVTTANASLTEKGGAGGAANKTPNYYVAGNTVEDGVGGATAGAGASVSIADQVAGITYNGTLTLAQEAVGGTGGSAQGGGGSGGAAGAGGGASATLTFNDNTQNATQSAAIQANDIAIAGNGGIGNPGPAGAGGNAVASTAITGVAGINSQATAEGGDGGTEEAGSGGAAGTATASASAISTGTTLPSGASISAAAFAGNGGNSATDVGGEATGAGFTGANGGVTAVTSVVAQTAAAGTASATAGEIGGDGGAGLTGANGGNGAASLMTNVVSGETNGGTLNLYQNADGGVGGTSVGGIAGVGGQAGSSLTFDDLILNANHSARIAASVTAQGGSGGTGEAGSNGAAGGAASGGVAITGAGSASATASITGGTGGTAALLDGAAGASGGVGGAVSGVTASATGATASASATATSGSGGGGGGGAGAAGAAGAVSGTTATADGVTVATASVVQYGGSGGYGSNGASGGAAASSELNNAASGETNGGTLTLEQSVAGGSGGSSDTGTAAVGGAATDNLTFDDLLSGEQSSNVAVVDNAVGGAGGGGPASAQGGSASGIADITASNTASLSMAITGGGGGSTSASSAAGGNATLAQGEVTAANATVTVSENGGAAGGADIQGDNGAAGGVASGASATADGTTSASATVYQNGGTGGGAYESAGGAGAASTLGSAVSGETNDGSLTLSQRATGGNGGGGSSLGTGGAGGQGVSNLLFDDLANATASATLNVTSAAAGGLGGSASGAGSTGGAGGSATSSAAVTGANRVIVADSANGGAGGTGAVNGLGGAASAISMGTGASVASTASAVGGLGALGGGAAVATAGGAGASGSVNASANSSVRAGNLVTADSASAVATVSGTSNAEAETSIGAAAPAFISGEQAVATLAAEPAASSANALTGANYNIAAAFDDSPAFFGEAELGGAAASVVTGTQTITDSVALTVDLTQLTSLENLTLGFANESVTGAGFSSLTLKVTANGVSEVNQTFSSVAALQDYFINDAIELGSLGSDGSTLNLGVNLTMTETAAGSGFAFDLLAGQAASTAATLNGVTIANGSTQSVANGTTTLEGATTNNGVIALLGAGTLVDAGTSIAGTGTIEIGQGKSLEIAAGDVVGAGQTIDFLAPATANPDETLKLDASAVNPTTFASTIAGFAPSDAIDLTGLSGATGYSFDGSTLTVDFAGGDAALNLSGLGAQTQFQLASVGGGTQIALPITEQLADDSGASGADNVTNDPALTGLAYAGETVTLSEGGTVYGSVVASSTGTWSFDPTGLADGVHDIVATESGAGVVNGSTSLNFTLLTSTQEGPIADGAVTPGTNGVDYIDAANFGGGTTTLTGAATAGDAVVVTNGSNILGTTTATGGVWSLPLTGLVNGESYSLVATATDLAGNVAASAPFAFTVDTTIPTVQIAGAGGTVTQASQTISGTGEAATTVTLTDNGAAIGSPVPVGSNGAWSEAITLASGANAIVATDTDPAGNAGTSNAVTYTLQSGQSPNVTIALRTDSGGAGEPTNKDALTGGGAARTTVTLSENGVTLGTTTSNAAGVWNFTPASLPQGSNTIVASETNTYGTGAASLTFVYDTVPPAVTISLVDDTGVSSTDKITSDDALTGGGDPSAVVTFTEAGAVIGTTTADASGAWTFTPAGLAQGRNTITASETDLAGNTGKASLTFTYESVAPAVTETLRTDSGGAGEPTNKDTLTGGGAANTVVTLTENGVTLGTTTSNGAGVWTFTPVGLAQGVHTVVASETDLAGLTGTASLTFTYDTVPPAVTISLVDDTGVSSTDKITYDDALTGGGDPNAVVTFTEAGAVIGTTTAGANGAWTFTPTGLAQGRNTITASETDLAGNTGRASLTFTYDSLAPTVSINGAGGNVSSSTQAVAGTGAAHTQVTLFDNGVQIGAPVAVNGAGDWKETISLPTLGANAIVAYDTDVAGNVGVSNADLLTLLTEPPTFTSAGGGASATYYLNPGATAVANVAATDPNPGADLSYALVNSLGQLAPTAGYFAINEQTGYLALTSDPVSGFPLATVEAFDNFGAQAQQAIKVEVASPLFGGLLDLMDGAVGDAGVTDTFVFQAPGSTDIVENFRVANVTSAGQVDPHGVLAFAHALFAGASAGESSAMMESTLAADSVQIGASTFIGFSSGGGVALLGVNRASLLAHTADYAFT